MNELKNNYMTEEQLWTTQDKVLGVIFFIVAIPGLLFAFGTWFNLSLLTVPDSWVFVSSPMFDSAPFRAIGNILVTSTMLIAGAILGYLRYVRKLPI